MQNAGIAEPDIIAQLDRGVTLPAEPTKPATDLAERFSALPAPVIVKLDTQDITSSIERLTAAQDRQTAAIERLAVSLVWFAAALVLIVLLTVAVAVGWL